ncbi:alpha/beta hydrolase [Flavobacteriaceae bacterium Ap0902]|nr:alpha/beta hydrolase [Flavobacteriaceae bacterium Ap0902]
MKKKVLYLHGLNSQLHDDRREVLKKCNLEIKAPLMDYENNPDALFDLIETFDSDLIIGSSAGGLIGYYISGLKQVPALLFNPALPHRDYIKGIKNLPKRKVLLHVTLGSKDEVVNPRATKNYLIHNEGIQSVLKIHWIENLEHRIPIDIFESEVKSFLKSLK